MTRARLATVAAALAALAWWVAGTPGLGGGAHGSGSAAPAHAPGRSIDPAVAQQLGTLNLGRGRSGAIDWQRSAPRGEAESVTVHGKVIDRDAHAGVGNVEVVFHNAQGEESATTAADGTYAITVPPGTYRAFVRDDNALSVGLQDFVRLPGMPSLDTAGVPDEGLMPTVVAVTDVDHVDLSVVFGGTVAGRVVDRSGHPIAGAVLRARGGELRPALGTDVAESDERGTFEMRLPPGPYTLEATHATFAGTTEAVELIVERGQTEKPTLTLTAGCVISGTVVGADGKPAGDGAIERRFGTGDNDFAPAGQILADGSFRWVTTTAESVTLRAWPWKSPPSPPQTFACRDGARFENVVYRLPNQPPDIAGTLVDASGAPVAFGFIDVNPPEGGFGQQERTDADGHWGVYHMPAGRYRITATAPGRGIVATEISAPRADVRLALGGTGRIDGTAPALAEGSFEVALQSCDGLVGLPHAARLVAVHDHHFSIEDVPACDLAATATWEGEGAPLQATVPAGGAVSVTLGVGPARAKTVHGVVRDATGKPLPNTEIVSTHGQHQWESTTDASGAYSLRVESGAYLMAIAGDRAVSGMVSDRDVDDEQLDLVLPDKPDGELIDL